MLAVFGAWRLYELRSRAVAPTAPKLVPAQEVVSCPAVSFTVGGGCPVANSTCCLQPLTTCDNSLQCGTGYTCTLGYCVKQTYDERTNTCPAAQAPAPGGSGGSFGGGDLSNGGGAPAGGTSPAASPRPSVSPSPSPSPSASPKAAAGATSSPSSSSTQTSQSGTSTSAPAATTKAGSTTKAQEKLPEAGVSWPFTVIMGGGVLLLILGIVLAF